MTASNAGRVKGGGVCGRPSAGPGRPPGAERRASYWEGSRRPLAILVFLLPLIAAYEAGLVLLLRSEEGVLSNAAHVSLLRFFDALGIAPLSGLYMGGVVIVVVLLLWHLLNRDPWRVEGRVVGGMAAESLLLSLPLLVLALLLSRESGPPMAAAVGASADLAELGPWSRLVVSIGAGLYEELIFRMVLIALVHTLLVDLLGAAWGWGAAAAVMISAIAFAAYHPLSEPGGAGLSPQRAAFFLLAGLYFGIVYVMRGFGVVVGAHAAYDAIVLLMPGEAPA